MTTPPRKMRSEGTGRALRAVGTVPLLPQWAEREGSHAADPTEAGASLENQGMVPKHRCPEPPETPTGAGWAKEPQETCALLELCPKSTEGEEQDGARDQDKPMAGSSTQSTCVTKGCSM